MLSEETKGELEKSIKMLGLWGFVRHLTTRRMSCCPEKVVSPASELQPFLMVQESHEFRGWTKETMDSFLTFWSPKDWNLYCEILFAFCLKS